MILSTDGQTDGRTDGQTDKVIPVYPPINFVEAGGIIMRCDMTWQDSEYNFESYHTSYATILRGSFNTNLISYFIRV